MRRSREALRGMRNLTMEQRAVYNVFLDLFMWDDGPVGVLAIANEFSGGQRRKVLRIINELLSMGVLDRRGDKLTDRLAEFEVRHRADRRMSRDDLARKTAYDLHKKNWAELRANGELSTNLFNEINGHPVKTVATRAPARGKPVEMGPNDEQTQANADQTRKRSQFDGKKPNEINGHFPTLQDSNSDSSNPCGPHDDDDVFTIPKRRARRCPASFVPSLDTLDDKTRDMVETWEPDEFDTEAAKFRDHEFDKPRSDWPATFRNWCRTHHQNRRTRRNGYSKPAGAKVPDLGHNPSTPDGMEWDDVFGTYVPSHTLLGGPAE
jgi:hypothetical protein